MRSDGQSLAIALVGLLAATAVAPRAVAAKDKSSDKPAPAAAAAAVAVETGEKVRLTFRTSPARRATVTWGGRRLGVIEPGKPLVIERPRDSGPMDIVIRAAGFLPLSTRAFTFKDATVSFRITPVAQKNTLFGYREELPPEGEVPGTPEAGGVLQPAAGQGAAGQGAAGQGAAGQGAAGQGAAGPRPGVPPAPPLVPPVAPGAPTAAQGTKPSAAPMPRR